MNRNNNMSYINIIIFISLIYVISILNITSPKDAAVSQTENRTLAQRPDFNTTDLFSGKYFSDFEKYFADHFYHREQLVQINNDLSYLKGIKRNEEASIVAFDGQNVGGNETSDNNNVEASTKGNLLILNDTVMELYKFNEDKSKSYADMIATVSNKLGKDVKVYSLLAPIQVEFLKNEKYKNLSDSQIDAIEFVNSNLQDGIIPVDAYHPIKEHIDEYVYFRTDHHWTALGAYYGYTGFAKAAGLEAVSLKDYQVGEASGYLGHISTVNPSETVNSNPDDVVYYEPPVDTDMTVYYYDKDTGEKKSYKGKVINKSYAKLDQKYGVFIGGDFPLGVIKTSAKSDKKIMVIKDSYGNAFIPFLTPHYSEIYVIDPRHYKESIVDLVEENNIGEVLFLNYVLTTNFENFIDSVLNLTE
ncbi:MULTISPECIES: DHHW family protein [unclassified Sedimentibacter]|uniref:DHHW family protein n=1 Tax=unclassified Sedimentibacter TaxID=2649220 RepID=UPI0027DF00A0|nr:DHHW family protein [Sedimentibacter sp. MB35-C1]WMJ76171.1 DHHW family protein [Sedimentibacter sp. MB35-C1]